MRKFLWLLVLALAGGISVHAQMGSVLWGANAPGVGSPDCVKSRVYVDFLTGNVYLASGSPCTWTLKDRFPGVTPDGSNGLIVTGTLAAPTVVATTVTINGTPTSPVDAANVAYIKANSLSAGTSPGIVAVGDSIASGTGSTPTAPFPINAFPYALHLLVGGPMFGGTGAFNRPSDQCEDEAWSRIYSKYAPQGNALDPEFVVELGTNDIAQYNTDANKQKIYQRCMMGLAAWGAIPAANKVYAGSGAQAAGTATLGGGMAADTSANAAAPGMGATCTTVSCTASLTITTKIANSPICFAYFAKDANGGTFTVKVDGTLQNDPFNVTTTWYNAGDGGAAISTQWSLTSTVLGACIPTTLAANHATTVLFTGTSATNAGNIVEIYWVGVPPPPSPANPDVILVSANPRQDAQAATVPTYNAFTSGIATALHGYGLNVFYADTYAAGLNVATPIFQQTTLTSTSYVANAAWTADNGVSYANALGLPGTALVKVSSAPAQGQYSVSAGTYTFAAADVGSLVYIYFAANCGANSLTTYATNCAAADTVHPNNTMHAVMAATIAAAIPAAKIKGITTPNSYQPAQYLAPRGTSPGFFPNLNPLNLPWTTGSAFSWGSIKFDNTSGPAFDSLANGMWVHAYPTSTSGECWWNYGNSGAFGGPTRLPTSADCDLYRAANTAWTVGYWTIKTAFSLTYQTTGTITVPASAITAGTCATVGPVTEAGIVSTSVIEETPAGDLAGTSGYGSGGLTPYPAYNSGSNVISKKVCNWSAGDITPGAFTWNIRWHN